MTVSQLSKETKEEFNTSKIKEVLTILLASKNGMTAVAVGEKIGLKDTRQVRVFLRDAIRQAEKEGHKTKRERVSGQTMKVYQIIKQASDAKPADASVKPSEPGPSKPASNAPKSSPIKK